MNLTQKILADHLISGELTPGEEISIRIDQTLTQDSTFFFCHTRFKILMVKELFRHGFHGLTLLFFIQPCLSKRAV